MFWMVIVMTNALFTDTVTLYNHYKGTWHRTVLHDVQWTDKVTKTIDQDGKIVITPEVSLTVQKRPGYVEPRTYTGTGFTFNPNNLDVVVLGEISDEITADFTITSLKKKYEHVVTIYGISDNSLRIMLKHWRVKAR